MNPKRTFVISDTHFNHTRIIELAGRPENFNDLIIANWQRVVAPEDTVIHLGDVILGKNSDLPNIMAQLPGTKILTLGNHDREKPEWYTNRGFHFACRAFILSDVLFSHVPIRILPENIRWNVHGHLHNNAHREGEQELKPHNKLFTLEHHYTPIELTEFLAS
jgi:calcineurin-like phosphoesterase family protein